MDQHSTPVVPRDSKRIDLGNAREVVFWCAVLKCTTDELRAVVAEVGVMTVMVAVAMRTRLFVHAEAA